MKLDAEVADMSRTVSEIETRCQFVTAEPHDTRVEFTSAKENV